MSDVPSSVRMTVPAAVLFLIAAVVVPFFTLRLLPMDVWLRFLLGPLWIILFGLACLGAGKDLVRLLAPPEMRLSGVFTILSGAAVLAWAGCIAAVVHCFHPSVLIGIFLLSLLRAGIGIVSGAEKLRFLPEGLVSPAGMLLLLPAFLTLAVVTTPPVMYDVLHYHLAFPEQWLLFGGFHEFPRESFSYYPAAGGMLYAYALAMPGAWGANAVNWFMGALAALTAGELGRRLSGPKVVVWVVACFVMTPAILETSAYASADLLTAAWAGGALLLLINREMRLPDSKGLLLLGFFIGSAIAAKYLALATIVFPLGLVFLVLLKMNTIPWKASMLSAAILSAGVLASCGPWLVRNVVWTKNPVYPYLQSILGGPETALNLHVEVDRTNDQKVSPTEHFLRSAGAFVLRSLNPRREGGLPGAHWLILLMVAAALRFSRPVYRLIWLYVLSGFLVWGFLVQYLRFLSPAFVGAAALAGTAIYALKEAGGRIVGRLIVLFFLLLFGWNLSILANPFYLERLRVVTGNMSGSEFRAHWDDRSRAVDYVSGHLAPEARILLVGECRGFGFRRRLVIDGPYHQSRLIDIAETSSSPEEMAHKLRETGVTHLLINRGDMKRLAGFRNISDFWAPASRRARGRIVEFFRDELELVFEDRGIRLARLKPADTGSSALSAVSGIAGGGD